MSMQLTAKGEVARLTLPGEQIKGGLHMDLTWSHARDLDLMCGYRHKNGEWGLVYFNMRDGRTAAPKEPDKTASLNTPPFMYLSKDAGVGGSVGTAGNKESLTISQLDPNITRYAIIAADYQAIASEGGSTAQFQKGGAKIKMTPLDGSQAIDIVLDAGQMGNLVCIAIIDNKDTGATVKNVSEVGHMKEFGKTVDDLVKAVRADQ